MIKINYLKLINLLNYKRKTTSKNSVKKYLLIN